MEIHKIKINLLKEEVKDSLHLGIRTLQCKPTQLLQEIRLLKINLLKEEEEVNPKPKASKRQAEGKPGAGKRPR